MEYTMKWESRFDRALNTARAEKKHILVHFFSPESKDCQRMDEVTYPSDRVVEFIHKNIVPLRVSMGSDSLVQYFKISQTPSMILLDATGREHHSASGFMPPEELIPSLLLGIANACFYWDRFSRALTCLERLLTEFPGSDSVPESIYLRGVCRYRSTYNSRTLKEAYEKLLSEYPAIDWRKWSYPTRSVTVRV